MGKGTNPRGGAQWLYPRTSGSGIPIGRTCLAAESSVAFVVWPASFSDLLPRTQSEKQNKKKKSGWEIKHLLENDLGSGGRGEETDSD